MKIKNESNNKQTHIALDKLGIQYAANKKIIKKIMYEKERKKEFCLQKQQK